MAKRDSRAQLDFEIGFFEGVLRKKEDCTEALQALSDAYTKKGRYKEGLEIDLRLLGLRKSDPTVFYNIACDYSLLNDIDKAFVYLKKAFKAGYGDIDFMLNDPDLANVRVDIRFDEFLTQIVLQHRRNKFVLH